MQSISRLIICAVSVLAILAVPHVYADINATRLVTDSKMCLASVDACVMVKQLHLAPLKQLNVGVGALDVSCNTGYQLVLKAADYMPACVKTSTVPILVERGWATSQDEFVQLKAKYEPQG